MKTLDKTSRYVYISGVVLFLAGTLDPMEGSVVIAIGSLLLAVATYWKTDPHWKFFLATFIMITIGVVSLFSLSSFGGFGDGSTLSWWWGLLILPYPIGWALNLIRLVIRVYEKGTVAHSG